MRRRAAGTEVAVDGVVAVMIQRGIAELKNFYQVIGIDPATRKEQRRIHHRISMPLASLEELAALILRRMERGGAPDHPRRRMPRGPTAGRRTTVCA